MAPFIPRYDFSKPPPGFDHHPGSTPPRFSAPGVGPLSLEEAWALWQSCELPPGMVPHPWASVGDGHGQFEHALVFCQELSPPRPVTRPLITVPGTVNCNAADALYNAWAWYSARVKLSRCGAGAWPSILIWSLEQVEAAYDALGSKPSTPPRIVNADPLDVSRAGRAAQHEQHVRDALANIRENGSSDAPLVLYVHDEVMIETPTQQSLAERRDELARNLYGWREDGGDLVPSEPDPAARSLLRIQLRAALSEVDRLLGRPRVAAADERDDHRDRMYIAEDAVRHAELPSVVRATHAAMGIPGVNTDTGRTSLSSAERIKALEQRVASLSQWEALHTRIGLLRSELADKFAENDEELTYPLTPEEVSKRALGRIEVRAVWAALDALMHAPTVADNDTRGSR